MKLTAVISLPLILIFIIGFFFGRNLWVPVMHKIVGKKTTSEVVQLYGPEARKALIPYFDKKGITYPPQNLTFLALKDEQVLELWAKNTDNENTFIRSYAIKKLSGELGPKLREGDHQVPEGIYEIEGLNPNSAYHLSIKLNYPNAFDLIHADKEGRTEPGSNIFIHGKSLSVGCLAMGDDTIEELFVLTSDVSKENISVIIAPYDPRKKTLIYDTEKDPEWLGKLYDNISAEFLKYRRLGS